MLRWISNNFRTFLWALAISIAVWIAAVTTSDPDETHLYPISIPIEIVGQDSGTIISADIPKEVSISLRAPRSVWMRLNANPGTVRAILDLSKLTAGTYSRTLQIQVDERPVRIIAVSPASVELTLEELEIKVIDVDINLNGDLAIGYQAGESKIEPEQITLSGPSSQVQKVKRAEVSINLNGLREDLDGALDVLLLDENGFVVKDVNISPEKVNILLPISQQGGYRDLAVKVNVSGQVAEGYRLANISVFPPVITVFSANANLVNELPGVVETMPIDLQNASDDISTRLELVLPAGVTLVGEQTVLIKAGIAPIESSLTLSSQQVEIIGLLAGYEVHISPETVDVIVSGPLPSLDILTRQAIRVVVDVTGLTEGTHQLTPKVEVLVGDVLVQSILPATIEVVLRITSSPTP